MSSLIHLVRGEVSEPSFNVGGIPSRGQASLLESPELRGGSGASCDHLIEAEFQSGGVFVGSLML